MKSSTTKLSIVRILTGKKAQVYFKIKDIGNKPKISYYNGAEMTIDELAELADTL